LGLLAGLYPALHLAAFRPITALHHRKSAGHKHFSMRKMLVTVQFVVSIIMIIASLIINQQLNYIQNKDLGFKKENIIRIWNIPNRDKPALKQELLKHPDIEKGSTCYYVPFIDRDYFYPFRISDQDKSSTVDMHHIFSDYDYVDMMGIEVIQGRGFDKSLKSDQEYAYLINETAAKRAGWDDPVGMKIEKMKDWNTDLITVGTIIGVVKDFHVGPMRNEIAPVALSVQKDPWGKLFVRLSGNNMTETISFIEKKSKEFAPGLGFKYRFIEDDYNRLSTQEAQLNKLFKYFSILTIIIACLGLFGLSSHAVQQRTKEIGIRKVTGASVNQIVALLSKDFTKLVLISVLIAWPIAYYAMDRWLQNFAYRTEMSWLSFVLAGFLALIISLITIGFHSIKAANANPIEALRDE